VGPFASQFPVSKKKPRSWALSRDKKRRATKTYKNISIMPVKTNKNITFKLFKLVLTVATASVERLYY
jgi:hypothetical protein